MSIFDLFNKKIKDDYENISSSLDSCMKYLEDKKYSLALNILNDLIHKIKDEEVYELLLKARRNVYENLNKEAEVLKRKTLTK